MNFKQWYKNNENVIDTFNDPVDSMEMAYDAATADSLLWLGIRSMQTAPQDGTEIYILFRHKNFIVANDEDKWKWQQWCKAHWADFNGGGWVWNGIYGNPVAWHAS